MTEVTERSCRLKTVTKVLTLYEKYLVHQQEVDDSSHLSVDLIKIEHGQSSTYLNNTEWIKGLNETDHHCFVCTDKIEESQAVIHAACACKPRPAIHAACLVHLQQYGELQVFSDKNETRHDGSLPFQSQFVQICGNCQTPFLGQKMYDLFHDGLDTWRLYTPRLLEPQVSFEEKKTSFPDVATLLVAVGKIQEVLKSILVHWHSTSEYNPILAVILGLLGRMHHKCAQSNGGYHSCLGELCQIAALSMYGPTVSYGGLGAVESLLIRYKSLSHAGPINPIKVMMLKLAIPEIIQYVDCVLTTASTTEQYRLRRRAQTCCLTLMNSHDQFSGGDVHFQARVVNLLLASFSKVRHEFINKCPHDTNPAQPNLEICVLRLELLKIDMEGQKNPKDAKKEDCVDQSQRQEKHQELRRRVEEEEEKKKERKLITEKAAEEKNKEKVLKYKKMRQQVLKNKKTRHQDRGQEREKRKHDKTVKKRKTTHGKLCGH